MTFLAYLPDLAQGILTTLLLMLAALAFGSSLALVMTLIAISRFSILRYIVNALVFFIRGTPLLVQIFLLYYGLAQFDWLKASPLWWILREPFACAVLALGLNTAAYTTVLFKGAIASVPQNEVAACQALGMSRALMLRRIILPQALRMAIPAYSNEVIMVLKATSLASTITILDLMGVANQLAAQTYETFEFLAVAGVIYLLLNGILVRVFKVLERKFGAHLT